jgi:hypothetical protein
MVPLLLVFIFRGGHQTMPVREGCSIWPDGQGRAGIRA